jgi:hypothetical protein
MHWLSARSPRYSFFIAIISQDFNAIQNSTELLGLSPRFLFSLECFTDILPDSQAALLWDNIQFLSESGTADETDKGSPHVFLLSGWAAPESSLSKTTQERRLWTCWCAIHHVVPSSEGESIHSNLVIMEFELEKDIFNPLYPSVPPETTLVSGLMSPTDGSDHIIVAHSAGTAIGRVFSPISSTSEGRSLDNIPPPVTSMSSVSTTAGDVTTPDSPSGLDGPLDWLPSTEDIIESTTSHAKLVPALERFRRITKGNTASSYANGVDSQTSSAGLSARRGRPNRGEAHAGGGMMDVFAVMDQINEQLGAATSLDMFMKVVVGVIKDLTQFHRVLVYQFDEAWNGQVVAELVDWSQTRDLYRGLHFPASDIPAQVSAC